MAEISDKMRELIDRFRRCTELAVLAPLSTVASPTQSARRNRRMEALAALERAVADLEARAVPESLLLKIELCLGHLHVTKWQPDFVLPVLIEVQKLRGILDAQGKEDAG